MPINNYKYRSPLPIRKHRTVLQLHRLWKKTEKRVLEYTAVARDVLKEITETVKPDETGQYVVYASDEKELYCYSIEKGNVDNTYSFIRTMTPLKALTRKEFLLISLDSQASILADKLLKYDSLSQSKLDKVVFDYFWSKLKEQLERKSAMYKPETKEGELLISVEVYNFVYNIGVKFTYGSFWYTWYGEDNRKVISFNPKKPLKLKENGSKY